MSVVSHLLRTDTKHLLEAVSLMQRVDLFENITLGTLFVTIFDSLETEVTEMSLYESILQIFISFSSSQLHL